MFEYRSRELDELDEELRYVIQRLKSRCGLDNIVNVVVLLGEFPRKNIEVMNKLSETLERHEKLLDKIASRLDNIALEINDIKPRAKKIDIIEPSLRRVEKDINRIAMELGALTKYQG